MDRRDWIEGAVAVARRWQHALLALLLLAFGAIFAAMLVELRRDAGKSAAMAAENVLRSVEDDVGGDVAIYANTLATLVAEIRGSRGDGLDDGHRLALEAHATLVAAMGDLFLFDADGALRARSHNFADKPEASAERAAFEAAKRAPGIRIGRPIRDAASGRTVLWISRRIERADGAFLGVVAGTLDVAHWQRTFSGYSIGPRSAINLFDSDGSLVARAPPLAAGRTVSLAGTSNFQRFSAEPEGAFVAPSAIDGEERAYRFRHIEGTPLIVDVATATAEIYGGWRRGAITSAVVFAALSALSLALRLLLGRELRRRETSEARYRALSNIDALTGLANRRRFDEALEAEWRRAQRAKAPLSLLLVDADHFKAFNDTYGHGAGDDCLKAIADAVGAGAGRAGDVAARYGGEEFVVLLPGTDAEGSLIVAEKIRAAVEARALPHAGNPGQGRVTVSLGTATLAPGAASTPALLLSAADQALYRAKHAGRNRVNGGGAASVAAPVLPDEAERLAAVERLDPADLAAGREGFDALAAVAAGALEAPMAFVTLVRGDSQDFLGRAGLDAGSIGRDASFCAHTIGGRGVFVVPDASADPRFAANPLVLGGPSIRFYAGAPIFDPVHGHPLGAVCVVDQAPRAQPSPLQAKLLADLALVAGQRLAARRTPVGPEQATAMIEPAVGRRSAAAS